jgi:hypothetical protein
MIRRRFKVVTLDFNIFQHKPLNSALSSNSNRRASMGFPCLHMADLWHLDGFDFLDQPSRGHANGIMGMAAVAEVGTNPSARRVSIWFLYFSLVDHAPRRILKVCGDRERQMLGCGRKGPWSNTHGWEIW